MARFTPSLTGPICRGVAVTPSDSTVLAATRGLWVGTVGNVAVEFSDGSTATLTAPALGVIHDLRVTKVLSTGTTAGSIVALY
jgi:hypothetical protein